MDYPGKGNVLHRFNLFGIATFVQIARFLYL